MKHFKKIVVGLILTTSLCMLFAACNEPGNQGDGDKTDTPAVTLQETCTIHVGEQISLTYTVENYEGNLLWDSSDKSVATVSDGLVTAYKTGQTVVSLTAGDVKKECAVTVEKATAVGTLVVDYEEVNLFVGGSVTITAGVTFKNEAVTGLTYEWGSTDSATLKVEGNADKAKVTALKSGVAKVTVKTTHLGETLAEEVTVKIKKDVNISLDNLTAGDDGYALDLVKKLPQGYTGTEISSFIPQAVVKVAGEPVANATVEVRIPQDTAGIVSYDAATGAISSLATGSGKVSLVYIDGTDEYELKLSVNVDLLTITVDKTFDLEKVNPNAQIPASEFGEDIVSASLSGTAVTVTADSENVILSGYENLNYGEYILDLCSANYRFRAKGFVLTMVINDAAELDSLSEKAFESTGKWNGYFALGNDIDYNKNYRSFCGLSQCEGWGGATGFLGTFDGRGHVIDGFRIVDQGFSSGLFGVIGATGVVKNVGFTNALISENDAAGLIADIVYGTIEDVFAEVSFTKGGRIGGLCRYALDGSTLRRLVVYALNCYEGEAGAFGVNQAVAAQTKDMSIDHCYAVSNLHVYQGGADAPVAGTETDTLKGFATFTAMMAHTFDMSVFTASVWDGAKDFPTCKAYVDKVLAGAQTNAITNDTAQKVSKTLAITGSPAFTYALKADTPDGIELSGNTVTITGNKGASFTVVATCVFDATVKVEKTFTVEDRQTAIIAQTFELNLLDAALEITLDEALEGEFISLKLGETVLTGSAYDADVRKLTLRGANVMLGKKGTSTLVIETSEYNYEMNGSLTATVASAEEWDKVLEAAASNPENWNGYYVLSADLDYTGKAYAFPAGGLNANAGFKGVFDGAGHAIKGITVNNEAKAFFGTIAASGIVENVAFVGCTILINGNPDGEPFISVNKSGLVCDKLYGTVRNVYLEYVQDGHWWCGGIAYQAYASATVENCYIKVTGGHIGDKGYSLFASFEEGATLSDVYVVTAVENMPMTKTGAVGTDPNSAGDFTETEDVCSFATEEALKAAEKDLTEWDAKIWDVSGGAPSFKGLQTETELE